MRRSDEISQAVRILRAGEPRDVPRTLVLYDIEEDRPRNRVVNICKDYGLQRIQYSAFLGRLNRNRREALCKRLQAELSGFNSRVRVQPICEKDSANVWILDQFIEGSLRRDLGDEACQTDAPDSNEITWNDPHG